MSTSLVLTKDDILKLFNTLKEELLDTLSKERKVESIIKSYRGIEGTEVTYTDDGRMLTLRYKGKEYDANEIDYALWVMFSEGNDARPDEMFNEYCARKLDNVIAALYPISLIR